MGATATEVLHIQTTADLSGVKAVRSEQAALAKDAQTQTTEDVKRIEKGTLSTRSSGREIAHLSEIAVNGTQSLATMAQAAGHLGEEMAHMSGNASIAASSAGIGVLGAAIGVLIGLAVEAKKALEEIPEGKVGEAGAEHLRNLHTEAQAQVELEAIERRRAALQGSMLSVAGELWYGTKQNKDALQAIVDLDAKAEAIQKRREEIEKEERARELAGIQIASEAQTSAVGRYAARLRLIDAERDAAVKNRSLTEEAANQRAANERRDLAKQGEDVTTKLAFDAAAARDGIVLNSFDARRAAADRTYRLEKQRLDDLTLSGKDMGAALQYQALQHQGILAALDREQKLANDAARQGVGLGSDNVADRFNARMAQIDSEAVAMRKNGIDEAVIAEATQQKIRKLRHDTALAAAADAKTIIDAMLSSGNKQIQAVGHFADTIRRVLIGADAARAAVRAAIEGGEAIASAAAGDFRGAALHAAAALQLGAAAALGAQESLGGGGGGSSGGGGGGGVAGSGEGTFSPRDAGGAGGVTLVLQTVNPYSREKVSEVQYLLSRAEVLKRPIQIPATTGLVGAN